MKSLRCWIFVGLVACLIASPFQAALAIAPFKKEFDSKYVKEPPATPEEESFAAAVKQAKCNVCHVGTKKTDRNAYGEALEPLLDKKTDMKDVAKIQAALDTVAAMKSKPDDPSSPTFGELIKQGKLPGGDEPVRASAR